MSARFAAFGLFVTLIGVFLTQSPASSRHHALADDARGKASIEERLETLEKKMDTLIEAVSELRQDSSSKTVAKKSTQEVDDQTVQDLRRVRSELVLQLRLLEETLAALNAQPSELPEGSTSVAEVELTKLRALRREISIRLESLNQLSKRGDEVTEIVALIKKAFPDMDALESVANLIQLETTRDTFARHVEALDRESIEASGLIDDVNGAEAYRRALSEEIQQINAFYQKLGTELEHAEAQLD